MRQVEAWAAWKLLLALVVAVVALSLSVANAEAGVVFHEETCTTARVTLAGFPSRGVHMVYAYGLGAPQAKSFTGTSATLSFPVTGVHSGESYTVLVSWRGSQGGTKPPPYSFTC